MRVTKKTLAQGINTWLDKVELPYSVSHEDIERTYFTPNEYESGATSHYITARHKTKTTYNNIIIYTMQSMRSMQDELKKFKGSKITVKNYGHHKHQMDYWVVIEKQ